MKRNPSTPRQTKPPKRFQQFGKTYPAIICNLGFPSMMAALTWVEDVLNRE